MLRTDLIELINSGNTWVFVGSGVSLDAGCPSWERLVLETVSLCGSESREKILADTRYQKSFSIRNFPQCFSRIESIAGRKFLEDAVTKIIGSKDTPGTILRYLSDWPVSGYITTNYDLLLENALREKQELGWLSVGNSIDEVRKVSGAASRLIWHIHGILGFPPDTSNLVLTDKDYDALYLESSHMVTQLRGLLSQRRIIFIGFGFEDLEVLRLLKLVGRLCTPARPAYAFLSGLAGSKHESERLEFLEKYNVDIIPYRVFNGSHDQLIQLINFYNSFILRRSLKFGMSIRPCPSYDPETTGLMFYNQLALRNQDKVAEEVSLCLLKSRILSLLKYQGLLTIGDIITDLSERIQLMQGKGRLPSPTDFNSGIINNCLDGLASEGFVNVDIVRTPTTIISLSPHGLAQIDKQAGTAKRLSEQFSSSLLDRARKDFPKEADVATRVAKVAECFFLDCVKRRALGVAMAINSPRLDFQQYHILGLLQSLPEYLNQLKSRIEALSLVRLIEKVLSEPSEAESSYISITLQAQFGVNLLGYDPETIQARIRDVSNSLFLIDSSTLIPFLARSSIGHASALLLISRLKYVGSVAATTYLIGTEIAEHARWAVEQIKDRSPFTPQILAAMTGRAGSRSNAFLEGFVDEVNLGKMPIDFNRYLDSVCNHLRGHQATDEIFISAINGAGINCYNFDEWEGFDLKLYSERDHLQEQIAHRRKSAIPPTYKHERQVRAEAEALIIVKNIRNGAFNFDGHTMKDAYFVSHTRAIDDVAGSVLPITMRPEAVIQWLSTITVIPTEELGFLFNGLLWEMSERGFTIVDRTKLQTVFSPLVVASREKFQLTIRKRSEDMVFSIC